MFLVYSGALDVTNIFKGDSVTYPFLLPETTSILTVFALNTFIGLTSVFATFLTCFSSTASCSLSSAYSSSPSS